MRLLANTSEFSVHVHNLNLLPSHKVLDDTPRYPARQARVLAHASVGSFVFKPEEIL